MVVGTQRMNIIQVFCGPEEKAAVQILAERRRQTVVAVLAGWIAARLETLAGPAVPRSECPSEVAAGLWKYERPVPRVFLSRHRLPLPLFEALRLAAARQGITIPGLLYAWIALELQRLCEETIGEK